MEEFTQKSESGRELVQPHDLGAQICREVVRRFAEAGQFKRRKSPSIYQTSFIILTGLNCTPDVVRTVTKRVQDFLPQDLATQITCLQSYNEPDAPFYSITCNLLTLAFENPTAEANQITITVAFKYSISND